jgi:hypothetical protein
MTETPRPTAGSDAPAATYVYGVVRAGAASPALLSDVEGVAAGAGVELVEHGRLAALVSPVPLAEFGEEVLEERLLDPEWLARRAQAHGRVLQRALRARAVVPFRFGAIFRGRGEVEALLMRRAGELERQLELLEDKVELGVKGFAPPDLPDRVRASLPEARRLEEESEAGAPGRRYLLEKQLEQLAAREAAAVRARIAEESHAALAAVAVAATVNLPQDAAVGGFDGEMLLNGAYLVGVDGQDGLLAEVEALRARFADLGVTFDPTGPWPPYNFVEANLE